MPVLLVTCGVALATLVGFDVVPWWAGVAGGLVAGPGFALMVAPTDRAHWWS